MIYGYVKNGLVVWYDGVNNTGNGHSASQTNWKNLAGSSYNAKINGATWGTNYLSFDGENDWAEIGNIDLQNVTIEAVVSQKNAVEDGAYLNNLNGAGIGLLGRSKTMDGYVGAIFSTYIKEQNNYSSLHTGVPIAENKIYSTSGGYNGTNQYLALNGSIAAQKTIKGTIKYSTAPMTIGCNSLNQSSTGYCTDVKVYSIRIYNRMLNKYEIRANYEEDKQRYNIE